MADKNELGSLPLGDITLKFNIENYVIDQDGCQTLWVIEFISERVEENATGFITGPRMAYLGPLYFKSSCIAILSGCPHF